MLQQLSIKQRLILLIAIVCGIQLLVTAYTVAKLTTIEHHILGIAERDMPAIEAITLITEHQLEQEILMERAFRYALEFDTEARARSQYAETVEHFDKIEHEIEAEVVDTQKMLSSAVAISDNPLEISAFESAIDSLKDMQSQHSRWAEHVHDLFSDLNAGHFHEAAEKSISIEAEAHALNQLIEGLLKDVETFTTSAIIQVDEEAISLEKSSVIASLISVIIAIVLAWLTINIINRGLQKAVSSLEQLAEGNFSQEVASDEGGELGRMLEKMEAMRTKVGDVLSTVSTSAGEVSGAIDLLAAASASVQENVQIQTQEIEQVASAMTEMESTAHDVARNATSTHDATEEAARSSGDSQRATQKALEYIQKLVHSLSTSGDAIAELDKNSQSIGAVLDVIKGIAEQTNLLALNAAIEAARAGEQGRGFAVVADEVRRLAQRTQESTAEIEAMIELFRQGSGEAVQAMNQSRELGSETITFSEQASELMQQVNSFIAKVNDMNLEIASAAEEQSSVVEEINRNLINVNDAAIQNTQQVDQSVVASEQLTATAGQLKATVDHFKLS